jgi:hypothetical protein
MRWDGKIKYGKLITCKFDLVAEFKSCYVNDYGIFNVKDILNYDCYLKCL